MVHIIILILQKKKLFSEWCIVVHFFQLLSLVPKTKLFGVQGGGIDTGPLKRSMQENGGYKHA